MPSEKMLDYTKARALGHSKKSAAALVNYKDPDYPEKKLTRSKELQAYYHQVLETYEPAILDLGMKAIDKLSERLDRTGKKELPASTLLKIFETTRDTLRPDQPRSNGSAGNVAVQVNVGDKKEIKELKQRAQKVQESINRITQTEDPPAQTDPDILDL